MHVPLWIWVVTVLGITAIIVADLVWADRRPHTVSMREATLWVLLYVGLAGAFCLGLLLTAGSRPAGEFLAGYITEYSLSVDNLFVFVILLSRFAVPAVSQHKVLLIGIAISLVLRAAFIAAGTAAVNAFEWVFYIFGALLIYTAIKLAVQGEEEENDFHDSRMVRLMRRVVPTSGEYDGSKLTTRVDGRRMFTPMVVVVLAIGAANVVFALDSIPAIFGLTQAGFLVFTANAFALMGLRQLYFLLGGLLDRLIYLSYGLAVVLGFIGVKLILEAMESEGLNDLGPLHLPHIGIVASLAFIAATLTVTSVASVAGSRARTREPEPARWND
ncbi:tellurite resistance protein TerC [Actinopolymorpha cephalotaxi]|uniref:Tellurite resistance protein TerC n=1 Tax=Actinopolymorpha cephalotaxi TaxID=504797 RepID=A0A1I2VAI8_9ACTN|nr:TerC/Alx family metal homeostasis membrane protein [Actinopolymorpha cephalotaxi]NYH84806.1 tellurite resistance protein TerC [Actinopolymorpha cephalotaxi]SFG86180.1 tellurite resistance protein TerC [Actinopolymorpha cephalotaxi]